LRSAYTALAALAILPLAASLTACGDTFGGIDPLIRADSFVLASPTGPNGGPSAVDVANNVLLTHPELPAQAGVFDLQVRQNGSTFSLVPSEGVGSLRGAGLQKTTRDITNAGNAPREVAGYTRTAVQVAVGETYFVQTRPVCSTTSKYGILQIVALKPDSGTMTLKLISNQNCDDERLEL
jgi:hypothetical protein